MSAWLLAYELKLSKLAKDKQAGAREQMWRVLASKETEFSRLTLDEKEVLSKVQDAPTQLWVWVGSLVGRLAQDGHVPPMITPSFGRWFAICEDANLAIRDVRIAIQVQMPFVYVHTLAALVHVTTFLYAVTFGL